MKKVECPSCGAIGVIRRRQWPSWPTYEDHQCPRCEGLGFILMDVTEFAKRRNDFRKFGRNPRYLAFGEFCEFTGLVKVRNIKHVITPRGRIAYSIFYKEHRSYRS